MKIVFCLYDLNYTAEFLYSWLNLCNFLNKKDIDYNLTTGDSCNAFYAKQLSLKGNVLAGEYQKPFQGNLNYDFLIFLSGDIIFTVNDIVNLINKATKNNINFLSAFVKNRHKLLNIKQDGLEIADYLDFDMVIIKKGVFETLTYPWFKPHISKNVEEQPFVDIDICKRIREEAGVNLFIDPEIVIKKKVLAYV